MYKSNLGLFGSFDRHSGLSWDQVPGWTKIPCLAHPALVECESNFLLFIFYLLSI